MDDLIFFNEGHRYELNGIRIPSVTQIMEPMSLMLYRDVPQDILAEAAHRGTRAHEAISNYVRYGIEETDEDTACYMGAFKRFSEDYHPDWTASEKRVYHRTLIYAGTLDLAGHVTPDDGRGIDVVDIKCTRVYHRQMLATQLGAYAEAEKSHGAQIRDRYGLQLLRNGTYRFEALPDGFKTFLHCFALHNAMTSEVKP